MSTTAKGRGLASIVNQFHRPATSILTVYMEGETPVQLVGRLKSALSVLPFRTSFSYIIFDHVEADTGLMQDLRISVISDHPGAKEVTLSIETVIGSDFFLPRDLETGEFANIEDQIQCLAVLRFDRAEEREQTDLWFEETRKRLRLPVDWQIKRTRRQPSPWGKVAPYE